jgi:hypothetical protein
MRPRYAHRNFLLRCKNTLRLMLRCIYDAAELAVGRAQDYFEVMRMINGFADVQKAGQEHLNRTMQSFGALSRGWQALAAETAGFSKQSFDDGAAFFEKLASVKSFDVAVATQADFVKASYEKAVGQAARMGELYLDVVKDVVKPFEVSSKATR